MATTTPTRPAGTVKGLRLASTDPVTNFHVAGISVTSEPKDVPLAKLTAADIAWLRSQARVKIEEIEMPAPAEGAAP